MTPVSEVIEALERRIDRLRVAVREAVLTGDAARARTLRAKLKDADQAWEDALAAAELSGPPQAPEPPATGPLLPLREQVYEALSMLQVPSAPRLIATVHEALFAATFSTVRVTSLRRDEERSFRTAPFGPPLLHLRRSNL